MTSYESHLAEIFERFSFLKKDIIHGYLDSLDFGNCSLYWRGRTFKRPYRVTWMTSGDRKINGEWKATDYIRSRCFGRVEKAIEFMKEFS